MDQLLIDRQLVQALAQYLANRPWREVDPLMTALAALRPPPKEKPESARKPEVVGDEEERLDPERSQ